MYKKIKLKQLESLIIIYETSLEFIDSKTKACKLRKEKALIEKAIWDNKYIMLSSKKQCGFFEDKDTEIEKIVKCDMKKVFQFVDESYQVLENAEFFHTVNVKIAKSQKVLSKYLKCIKLDNELDKFKEKAIYSFKFPNTYHLNFEDTFFGLYPFVDCKRFRKICEDSRLNEFCGNPNVNDSIHQLAIDSEILYSESHNLVDDYRVYISTEPSVIKAYTNYTKNYSPYENAKIFLEQKEKEFMSCDKSKYVEAIKEVQKSAKLFFDDIPNGIMDINVDCDFSFLDKYKGKYNDELLKSIVSLKLEYKDNCKSGKQNNLVVDKYEKVMLELLESIGSTFYSDLYIREFEKKYNFSFSVVEYMYSKKGLSVLEIVESELKIIENEFKELYQFLLKERQLLIGAKEQKLQMVLDVRKFIFDDGDMEEIKKTTLGFNQLYYEDLDLVDDIFYSQDTIIGLSQIPKADVLAASYGVFLVTCLVSEFCPKFHQKYYCSEKNIDFNLLEEFKEKVKILK